MSRAVLSLGSNLGDRAAHLRTAVAALGPAVLAVSHLYRTPPWGPVPQPDYLNLALVARDDDLGPAGWLARCRELEAAAGRDRSVRWGPRTLDADVVTVRMGDLDVVDDDPELTLPHPRAAARAFVLVPWAEIDPDAELPGHGPVAALLAGLDTSDVERIGSVHGG
ncbi:2-amino-4-hydroxy-6-hydroxymethyldihydropteridine diphosphokinase [Nakamurella flavida]|uniref:2-amino-4-hydroxy-6-hydroxymethyldihydropteridine diphosphokinase n=1 Tax=Nakamurella flavida TaxID=363630 RepID=A0A939C263_9ACTN|nr:2-amino-4-hydroxy-6-hydroxymethyldihydropteridine diphosphokinase [Nakamurella flavida]MBM9475726.1 2-amino-4-hydroxy-6-hydroxymethyldihydropteridine diphosphokinase [Nakamurella flavida]MDP9777995.1 2-amino-4-hydroxy-6-hydroxymethyldihydropteridine diphosphokinase [Nakamurella flavida]